MKNFFPLLFLFSCCFSAKAQNLHLKLEGISSEETNIIDSIGYKKQHENAKSILAETDNFSVLLFKKGYLESQLLNQKKVNDSTFVFYYSVGKQTNFIHIYIGTLSEEEKKLLEFNSDTIKLQTSQVENFMNSNLAKLEQKGYSLSELQLVNHKKDGNRFSAALKLKTEKKRNLNDIVIVGYTKFPEGIRRNIAKQYRKRAFNQENLKQLNSNFKSLPFVNQIKYPEILFTKDSTKVYVYLEKTRANRFDGFIGFANEENAGIRFNGYLDLLLNNALNTGEKVNLYWKSDGKKQTTFNIGAELPYIFKSPLGIKANLKIFKQDSTFQNTTTDLNLGYYFSYNSKVYLGYQSAESVDIQKSNNAFISSYSNSFWTTSYEFTDYNIDDFLFREKTSLFLKFGIGNRKSKIETNSQYFVQLNAHHNFYLNKKNSIAVKNQSFYLQSDNYIINELYRFGGINSIRGFSENSLQASLFSGIMAEYRYTLSPSMYVHTITDYGYFQDKSSNLKDNLLGLGFGFGMLTKNGLFNLIYANGSTGEQAIKLSNSIVHISFKTNF
ncbi:outer membrane protein [Flavobacterium cauense R2A-7]|uniref:Outer membrane translocation and assembly module TamA n=1 Tax=Flavobacterium cauense R2A-7 TaxID=1341154 RepID=V6S2J0_9FLAO|nr:outer membrane protein [Flavobacterium cauense]ESU20878.1 outer membrane protein [Flavobacterium cauense R2A-7]KGO82756.1 membrane protein [Flavobacterium cauense R2A-7]TWI12221.1 outer membrane translocation and assembly module TamA [Flavobacterium cauense R2A-7]